MGKYLFTLKAVLLLWLSSEGLCYTCQPPTLWQKVANNVCQYPSFFHCLRDDKSNDYAIMCLQPIENPAGSSIVYDTSLNAERCQKERYQPKPYWSNALNQCVFKKSLCSEEGQVIYDNGTETIDRTCRCDYRKGYAFITPPKHTCYCVPSAEECGCYIKRCPNSSYVMTSEYTCMIGHSEEASLCQNFPPDSGPPTQNSKETIQRVRTYDLGTYNIKKDVKRSYVTGAIVVITIVAIVALIGGILWNGYVRTCIEIATGGKYAEQVNTVKRLTQKEIKYLKMQNVFVNTKSFRQAKDALDQHNIVVIKGRYGTGKSTIALQLASDYVKRNFEPYKFDAISTDCLNYLMKSKRNRVIILENIMGDILQRDAELMEWKRILSSLFQLFTNLKLIITTHFVNEDLRQNLDQHIDKPQATFVDLDDNTSLDFDDKKIMLKNYYAKHSRHCTDNIDTIAHCNPVVGFPLMCSLFASDDNNFSMGVRYFLQPPTALVEQIEKLKVLGIDSDSEAIKYSVLVYVSFSKANIVNVHRDHVNLEVFKTIYKKVYAKVYVSDVSFIQYSASRFCDIYIVMDESGDCKFLNPAIRQAVQISFGKIDPKLVIEYAPLEDLLLIIRPEQYQSFPKESVLKFSKNSSDLYEKFAQRIAAECIQTCEVAEKVGVYLYEYTVKREDSKLLEFVLGQLKEKTENGKNMLCIPSLISVFQKITNNSNECLPVYLPPIQFRLTWEIICAAKNSNEETLLQLFENSKTTDTVRDVVFSVVDEYNNTLLHYFVVWGYNAGLLFLEQIKTPTELQKNRFGFTAIHFAAVLARPEYLRILVILNKTSEESKQSKVAKFREKFLKEELKANQSAFLNISYLIKEGERMQGQSLAIYDQKYVNIDKHIISFATFGQKTQYDRIFEELKEFYKQISPKIVKDNASN